MRIIMELHNWNEKEATHGYGLGSTCNNIKTYFGEKKKKKNHGEKVS
jgi:hypothetical protein